MIHEKEKWAFSRTSWLESSSLKTAFGSTAAYVSISVFRQCSYTKVNRSICKGRWVSPEMQPKSKGSFSEYGEILQWTWYGIICRTDQSYKSKVYKLLVLASFIVLASFRCPNNFQAVTGQRNWNVPIWLNLRSPNATHLCPEAQPKLLVIWLGRTGGTHLLPSGKGKKAPFRASACPSQIERPSCECSL